MKNAPALSIGDQVRELIAEHWTCFDTNRAHQSECPALSPCPACKNRSLAFNILDQGDTLKAALRPFAAFGEYVGGLRVTVAGAAIEDDEVLPDDEIATIGNSSGFATIRGKHFAAAAQAMQNLAKTNLE